MILTRILISTGYSLIINPGLFYWYELLHIIDSLLNHGNPQKCIF